MPRVTLIELEPGFKIKLLNIIPSFSLIESDYSLHVRKLTIAQIIPREIVYS